MHAPIQKRPAPIFQIFLKFCQKIYSSTKFFFTHANYICSLSVLKKLGNPCAAKVVQKPRMREKDKVVKYNFILILIVGAIGTPVKSISIVMLITVYFQIFG